ncbi:GNAT family N-acetyltransferase [Thermincola ferriacetica]
MHLEGKKTSIRTIARPDLPLLVKWKNDPVIGEMVCGNPVITTLELEEKRFERQLEEYSVLRLIIENEKGVPIGFMSVTEIDKFNRKVELGMLIGEKNIGARDMVPMLFLLLSIIYLTSWALTG